MNNYWEEPYIEPTIYDEIFAETVERLKEALDDTVKTYINENAIDLEYANQTIKELQKKTIELSNQIKDIEKIREEIKQEIIKEMCEDIVPGDTVWLVEIKDVFEKCPICNGMRQLKAKTESGVEVKATCPHCEFGKIKTGVKYSVDNKKLNSIIKKIYFNKNIFEYKISGYTYHCDDNVDEFVLCTSIDGKKVFRTKKDAEEYIEKLKAKEC